MATKGRAHNRDMAGYMTKEMLTAGIKAAFSGVEYPGDENIIPSANELEKEVVEYLKLAIRQGYSEEKLRYFYDDLGILTPEAFHYFLSAYLLAELEGEKGVIGQCLAYWFAEPRSSGSPLKGMTAGEWRDARLKRFSPRQREALLEFLRYEAQGDLFSEDAHRAIQNLMAENRGT